MLSKLSSRSASSRRRTASGTLIAACLIGNLVGDISPTPAAAGPSAPAGWGQPLVEDFEGTALDPERWTAYHYPDTEPRRSRDLAHVRGGRLVLEGTVNAQGKEIAAGLADHLDQTYGRWEIRFRVDSGAGYGAAILLWPTSENWPDEGEIDILEAPRTPRNFGYNLVHLGPNDSQASHKVTADFTRWHTVGVDWSPDQLVYYLDGVETWRAPTRLVPDKLMRLALQFDACAPQRYGAWIPCRDASSPPTVEMEVDWVKVYPYDPNTPWTPPTTVPTTTPPATAPPATAPPPTSPPGSTPPPAPARPVVAPPAFTG